MKKEDYAEFLALLSPEMRAKADGLASYAYPEGRPPADSQPQPESGFRKSHLIRAEMYEEEAGGARYSIHGGDPASTFVGRPETDVHLVIDLDSMPHDEVAFWQSSALGKTPVSLDIAALFRITGFSIRALWNVTRFQMAGPSAMRLQLHSPNVQWLIQPEGWK